MKDSESLAEDLDLVKDALGSIISRYQRGDRELTLQVVMRSLMRVRDEVDPTHDWTGAPWMRAGMRERSRSRSRGD